MHKLVYSDNVELTRMYPFFSYHLAMEEFLINYYFYIYGTSLTDLKHTTFCKEAMITKSSIMLGLGETGEEVKQASTDRKSVV